jgi:thiamine-phosphate pyrophosphorylase
VDDASRRDLSRRRLYLCTPDRSDVESFVGACIDGGVDIVQLRDNTLDARAYLARAALIQRVCTDNGVPFFVNDRPDLALELDADGVHVGQGDAPPSLARRIVGDGSRIGLSTHEPQELDASAAEPVDYVSTGPVSPTPSKPGRPGTGLSYLSYAARTATRPWFVTGGVTTDTVEPMLEAGARRFVVVRWLTDADDPRARARSLRAAVDRYEL